MTVAPLLADAERSVQQFMDVATTVETAARADAIASQSGEEFNERLVLYEAAVNNREAAERALMALAEVRLLMPIAELENCAGLADHANRRIRDKLASIRADIVAVLPPAVTTVQ
jgi:hypothetical protein